MAVKKPANRDRRSDWAPTVTAILPSYNAVDFVQDTLDSLAAQTWPNLEILIGDDASRDGTPDILRAFAEGRENVRLIMREGNLGWIGNTNDLMAQATGEFMFFAFHDDTIAPTYVEKLTRSLMGKPEAVLAYSDLEKFEPDGTGIVLRYTSLKDCATPFARARRMTEMPVCWWVPNHGVFRTSAFRRIGGMKRHDQGEFMADWPWLLHMSILGEFGRVPEVLCRKYYKTTSLSKVWRRGPDVWAALYRSAAREIRSSDLDSLQKAALLEHMKIVKSRHSMLLFLRRVIPEPVLHAIPGPVRHAIRRLLT